MRVRHRIPSIFNLSMVDVLCCALGCVILLWLINLREAKHHEESAVQESQELNALLEKSRADRNTAYGEVGQLKAQLASFKTRLSDEQSAARGFEEKWKDAESARVRLLAALKTGQTEKAKLEGSYQLALRDKRHLEEERKDLQTRLAALQDELETTTKAQDLQRTRAGALARELEDAGRRIKALQTVADQVPELQSDLKSLRGQYATEHALANALEREIARRKEMLATAEKSVEQLQLERKDLQRGIALADEYKKKWASSEERVLSLQRDLEVVQNGMQSLKSQAQRIRAASANRFAGITLTGRRVLFLVDMSGSMELMDETTPAPNKWSEVANTVARVMRSMPDLEKYQLLVFAERPSFVLGQDNTWLTYDPKTSADGVIRALSALKPKGGTNLYAALETAFRMRAIGLDTIYLLSDGLPNMGEGIAADQLRNLTEAGRSTLLSRHLRRTLRSEWNSAEGGQPRVRINTIGFFFESPDVGAFLWALARENDGSFVGMSQP